ncbi:MAG: toll/interleukin-1 receptor domain-containing protein, partial [Alphaproteobacteria bacterium]|nr:toll/interleukin-1 receptor domain-containing protein [Alphaproteobacteria bacterium]
MGDRADVFLSYRRKDADHAVPLVEALKRRGLVVWWDRDDIDDAARISRAIAKGVAKARTLVAWYSKDYPRSRPCQWELAAAWMAAAHEPASRRVLVVNPEADTRHIQPEALADRQALDARLGPDALAERIAAVLDEVSERTLGEIHPLAAPLWHGARRLGSNRFVGRVPDLWKVHSGLTAASSVMITDAAPGTELVQVRGLGGIGKSLLAEEYALRFGPAHPGGVFWLNAAAGGRDPQVTAIAKGLGAIRDETDMAVVEGRLRRHLADQPPYLWVVDDLPPGAEVAVLLQWIAPTPNGRGLITTRGATLDGTGTVVPLGVLEPDEALQLLAKHKRPDGPREEAFAAEVVTLLGNHALAVDVAGAAVRKMGYEAFRDALRDPDDDALDLAKELAPQLPNDHEKSIAATLLSSVRRLDDDARRVLRLASILAPAPIPRRLVSDVFERLLGEKPGRRTALIAVDAAEKESLLEDSDQDVLVHALVSRTMRFHDPADQSLRHAAIAAVTAVMPGVADIREHAALQDWVAHARVLSEGAEDIKTATLLGWVGRHDFERGEYSIAEAGYRREQTVRARLAGEEHPETLTAMNNLALTLKARGDFGAARVLQELALAVHRRVLGDEHYETLTVMNNLALTRRAQGDFGAAREIQEHVLEVCRRVLGEEHSDTLATMGNLAETLRSEGDFTGARRLQEQALAIFHRLLGGEHPRTLTLMNNLAETLRSEGNLDGARKLQEGVLASRGRVLGEEHPDTLMSMNNLAGTLGAQGDLSGARGLQEQVLTITRR